MTRGREIVFRSHWTTTLFFSPGPDVIENLIETAMGESCNSIQPASKKAALSMEYKRARVCV